MCYSAMVAQNAKKLGLKYKARIDIERYEDLFVQRLKGEKLQLSRAMETPFLVGRRSHEEKEVGEKIEQWKAGQISKIETELFAQKKRLADAERKLESKITKKAQEDVRIATNKIEKFKKDLSRLQEKPDESRVDDRIFPFNFASILALDDKGERIIMPVRYHMRPHDKDESFDRERDGCYNARLDSLNSVPWWRASLGKRHGVLFVRKFYENVETKRYLKKFKLAGEEKKRENIVLCFEPDDTEYMIVPVIWDVWTKKGQSPLYGAALITDDPAPEIAEAGHDRTPIFLKYSAIEEWLHATGSYAEIKEVLSKRERPHYRHSVATSA